MTYTAGDTIGEIITTATDTTSAVTSIQSIMNHSDRFETGEDIVLELYELFRNSAKIYLLYFEVMVSQLMRDPDKLYYPYRMGRMNKPPKFVSIKAVPGLENPKRGIMFERILDVVTNSVLDSDRPNDNDERLSSDLESLFDI